MLRPSYWPGQDGHWARSPKYDRLILIADNIAPLGWNNWQRNRDKAIRWWMDCGADIRLQLSQSREALVPGTITFAAGDEGPYGWYDENGGYGYVSLSKGDQDVPSVAHELGHALGFGHTGSPRSIMSQWNTWTRKGVGTSDCRGLRHYYGKK
jgi:hypothetical protein